MNTENPSLSHQSYQNGVTPIGARQTLSDTAFREMEAALMEQMLPFAEEVYGEGALQQAFTLFLEEPTEAAFDPEDAMNSLFIPWFLYNWVIEDRADLPSPDAPLNTTVAEAFMAAAADSIDAASLLCLKASNRRPLSFFEVEGVIRGKSLKLRDLMQDETVDVDDNLASETLKKGEIIVGSIMLPLEAKVRALALSPYALPAHCKQDVIDLKEEILEKNSSAAVDATLLHQEEAFVLGLYLDLLDENLEDE